jgi:lipopolysaccharide export system permease protein
LPILFGHLARRTLVAVLGALAGVVLLYLAVDFVDNSGAFSGPGWLRAVLDLYANKAAVVTHMVAPAAILLGTSMAVSGLRATREWTAMRALGLGPWRVGAPVITVTLVLGLALVVLHDAVGVHAALRAEEIRSVRFGRGSDAGRYLASREPNRWFRGRDGRRIYDLRGHTPDGGFLNVTVLEVDDRFRLVRRIDASHMTPAGGEWLLEDVLDRSFGPSGDMKVERYPERQYRFDEPPEAFAVVPGKPAELRWRTLVAQIDLRRRLGLPTVELELERDNRLAYPFAGVSGAVLALALALRRNRKGHVSAALVEAVGVSLAFWGAQGISWALALSGRVPTVVAAWAPNALFLSAGVLAVRKIG